MSHNYNKNTIFLKKISYRAERLDDSLVFFDFYDPSQQNDIKRELSLYEGLSYEFFGGHNLSERKMLCIFSTNKKQCIEWPMLVCSASIDFKVDHRMILGAIMQLGINRETLGDILIQDDKVQIVARQHIASYISYISVNLLTIKGRDTQFLLDDITALSTYKQNFEIIQVTINSFRIDAIISAAYGISRDTATDIIKKRGVKINHEEKIKSSLNAQIGDLFSVRGKGRFVLDEFNGLTKKNKNKVTIKKYM
ncbi:hypothetical protein GC105_09490 [Alkalibaculum sp. M08DMB]|uniref:RNA-binding S4 domain-containing protein n=1 Tax=Alkalibaculum sporogenes TaxID=2655001 RepID=A0A6A7K9F2_9FIRM|nr:YlmH/Sll1252 family protein [Alkalibaculum sporogenes]MPW26022.1 hypothetical protein [Alkalibaculum sporogenes]